MKNKEMIIIIRMRIHFYFSSKFFEFNETLNDLFFESHWVVDISQCYERLTFLSQLQQYNGLYRKRFPSSVSEGKKLYIIIVKKYLAYLYLVHLLLISQLLLCGGCEFCL